MEGVYSIWHDYVSLCIIVGLIVMIIAAVHYGKEFAKLKNNYDKDVKTKRGKKEHVSGGYVEMPNPERWEDVLRYEEDFSKLQGGYQIWEQIIPLFPLAGLLGTVLGLIGQLGDSVAMMTSLANAMYTTMFGILASIILKVIDAIYVGKLANELTSAFDIYERNYRMTQDKARDNGQGEQG